MLCLPRPLPLNSQLTLHTLALSRPVCLRALLAGSLTEGAEACVRLELLNGPEFVLQGASVVLWQNQDGRETAGTATEAGVQGREGGGASRMIGVGCAACIHGLHPVGSGTPHRRTTHVRTGTPNGSATATITQLI